MRAYPGNMPDNFGMSRTEFIELGDPSDSGVNVRHFDLEIATTAGYLGLEGAVVETSVFCGDLPVAYYDELPLETTLLAEEDDPSFEQVELAHTFSRALKFLPPDRERAIRLKYGNGYTYADIATELGLNHPSDAYRLVTSTMSIFRHPYFLEKFGLNDFI